jgi:hypothetical protein
MCLVKIIGTHQQVSCVPLFAIDDLDQLDRPGSFGSRCKIEHQRSAAVGQAFLVEHVEGLFAFVARTDQPGFPQDSQVMRDGRLGDVQLLDDLIDRQPLAADQCHDLLAGIVSQGLGEFNRF